MAEWRQCRVVRRSVAADGGARRLLPPRSGKRSGRQRAAICCAHECHGVLSKRTRYALMQARRGTPAEERAA